MHIPSMRTNMYSLHYFKGFMTNNAHANWNAARKIYRDSDPSLHVLGLFHKFARLDKVKYKYIKPSFQFNTRKNLGNTRRKDNGQHKGKISCATFMVVVI